MVILQSTQTFLEASGGWSGLLAKPGVYGWVAILSLLVAAAVAVYLEKRQVRTADELEQPEE